MLGFVEEGKQENAKKNPPSKARTNNKLNPHVATGWGPRGGGGGGKGSALTLLLHSLLSQVISRHA